MSHHNEGNAGKDEDENFEKVLHLGRYVHVVLAGLADLYTARLQLYPDDK